MSPSLSMQNEIPVTNHTMSNYLRDFPTWGKIMKHHGNFHPLTGFETCNYYQNNKV